MGFFFSCAVGLAGMSFAAQAQAPAQISRPLVQEGKTALYQRIITVPGAAISRSDNDSAAPRIVPPFSTYYVYERRQSGGQEWLQVGTDSTGSIAGWLPGEQTVDWKQTLTVAFRDPQQQPRVLLFSDRDALKTIVSMNPIMIDGTGMCGVCRLTVDNVVKFACVDGPDFDGHLVDWKEFLDRRKTYYEEEVSPLRKSGCGTHLHLHC